MEPHAQRPTLVGSKNKSCTVMMCFTPTSLALVLLSSIMSSTPPTPPITRSAMRALSSNAAAAARPPPPPLRSSVSSFPPFPPPWEQAVCCREPRQQRERLDVYSCYFSNHRSGCITGLELYSLPVPIVNTRWKPLCDFKAAYAISSLVSKWSKHKRLAACRSGPSAALTA